MNRILKNISRRQLRQEVTRTQCNEPGCHRHHFVLAITYFHGKQLNQWLLWEYFVIDLQCRCWLVVVRTCVTFCVAWRVHTHARWLTTDAEMAWKASSIRSTPCCGKIETCVRRQAVRLATWLLFITDARARRADKIATSITRRCGVAEFTHAEQQASHADRTLRAQCAAVASLRS